ncbi:CoA transferase subunit A [Citrobacter freundii]|uniref:3-oxoacid CoA-transferase subunit A n=1 Tax=Bordetella petrii (strain ATCC BAA-461 / DSM 12804 / CCUG 43448 / CIP 107267 / Se-1111R) TaxID=340100 RepID=A9IEJ0_BORPD|nr:CoA-transferase [Citrobacter freundii]CAP41760.1 3-oxoacid CoA-transferase subunit A, fragment [Bordetella petrii]
METRLVADLAIVHAYKGDEEGNLVYRKTARNFNPMMATAASLTVAEDEQLVPAGEIDPDTIHTPGIYVRRIVHVPRPEKRIEQRTVRPARQKECAQINGVDPKTDGCARRP